MTSVATGSPTRPERSRRDHAVVVLAAALAAVLLAAYWRFFHDDAYITLRYASRLLAGLGPTWSAGERVEGFTHPLWLAQVTIVGGLGPELPAASRVLGLAYLAGLFALWLRSGAAKLPLLLVATHPGLILWTLGGLETTSFAFWLAAGAWLTQRCVDTDAGGDDPRRIGLLTGACLAAAALTRPEGMGSAAVALAWLVWRRRWQHVRWIAIVLAVALGGYEVFRLAYYGALLPNTAHVKLAGMPPAERVGHGLGYLWRTRALWLPATAVSAGALLLARRRPVGMLWLALPVLVSVVAAGGDHMRAARLLVPAVVVVVFAAGVAGRDHGYRRPRAVAALIVVACITHVALAFKQPAYRDPAAVVGEPVGKLLESRLPGGSVVALATAGSTPYFAPSLAFIDTLGLNDRHIARREVGQRQTVWQAKPGHQKGDGAYVLAREPDVVLLGPAEGYLGRDPRAWFLTDYELLTSPEFRSRYRPYLLRIRVTPEQARWAGLAQLLDPMGALPVVVYVRDDSAAARGLIVDATALTPPWALPAADRS